MLLLFIRTNKIGWLLYVSLEKLCGAKITAALHRLHEPSLRSQRPPRMSNKLHHHTPCSHRYWWIQCWVFQDTSWCNQEWSSSSPRAKFPHDECPSAKSKIAFLSAIKTFLKLVSCRRCMC